MGESMFSHAFWGEKNAGFDVFNQNLKAGIKNTSEFYDFLREINSMEDTYGKGLSKISKQISSYSMVGSFKPCWLTTGTIIDKFVTVKSSLDSERLNIMKDVQKYLDELQKKQRQMKDSEAATQEVVHSFQVASTQLQKAKDLYHTRYKEYERVRLNETHSERDKQKAETKLKKAQDDYKYSVEKYNNLRTQFVDKMRISCSHFEKAEFAHLEKMCEFLERYGTTWESTAHSLANLIAEFNAHRVQLTPETLMAGFVLERGTGKQEPLPAAFEDVEVAAAFNNTSSHQSPHPSVESICGNSLGPSSPNFSGAEGEEVSCLRAASAQATVGNPDNRECSPLEGGGGHDGNHLQSDSAWQLGETSSAQTTWKQRTDFGGSLFSRRKRQNSCGLETTNTTSAADAVSTSSGGIVTNGSSGGSSLALRLANVRNRTRISRMSSNSPVATGDAKSGSVPPPLQQHMTDEEGYTIRPENPWDSPNISGTTNDTGSDESDTNDKSERTFKGIKIKIRPLGDLAPAVISASNQDIVLAAPQLPARRQLGMTRAASTTSQESGGNIHVQDLRFSMRPHTSASKMFPQEKVDVVPPLLPPPPSHHPLHLLSSPPSTPLSSSFSGSMDTWAIRRPRPNISNSPSTLPNTPKRDNAMRNKASFDEEIMSVESGPPENHHLCNLSLSPNKNQSEFEKDCTPKAIDDEQDEQTNSCTALPNPAWEASFPSPSNPDVVEQEREKVVQEVPHHLIDFGDDQTQSVTSPMNSERTPIGHAPIADIDEANDDAYEELNSRALARVTDGEMNALQLAAIPPPPLHGTTAKPTPLPPSIRALDPLSFRALPTPPLSIVPIPILSISVAITETWRVQFPNGGGSSFTTALLNAEAAPQSLSGQVTLAVPWEELDHLKNTNRVAQLAKNPLVFVLTNTRHIRALSTHFSGIQFKTMLSDTVYVTIPGELLYTYLISSSTRGTKSEDFARLILLDYSVDLKEGIRPPIIVCTYWRCESNVTDFRLDYFIQWPQWPPSENNHKKMMDMQAEENNLYDIRVMMMVDGCVTRVHSRPLCTWNADLCRANWTLPQSLHDVPPSNPTAEKHVPYLRDNMASGLIRAKFSLGRGPGKPHPVGLQFCHDGGPLPSGVTISLLDLSMSPIKRSAPCNVGVYYFKMCKYRLLGDRYYCDPPISHSPS